MTTRAKRNQRGSYLLFDDEPWELFQASVIEVSLSDSISVTDAIEAVLDSLVVSISDVLVITDVIGFRLNPDPQPPLTLVIDDIGNTLTVDDIGNVLFVDDLQNNIVTPC